MPNSKMSRIDEEKLVKLAQIGLTTGEIASVLGCCKRTLETRFKESMEIGREYRNASVRRKQFELAMAGNPTMLVWLGKQYLGQHDKLGISAPDGGPVQIITSIPRPPK